MTTGIRPYGPGKFDTILDSYVYTVSLDGIDEEAGDAGTGWYGLLRGDLREAVTDAAHEAKDKLTQEELKFLAENKAGAIIEETDQGFVSVENFSDDVVLDKEWARIVDAVEDAEDEDDGSYEGAHPPKTCVRTANGKIACGTRLGGSHGMGGAQRIWREILPSDVGRPFFTLAGRNWPVVDFMGQILPNDVGKRVYLVGDILQVENNEQRDARKSRDLKGLEKAQRERHRHRR